MTLFFQTKVILFLTVLAAASFEHLNKMKKDKMDNGKGMEKTKIPSHTLLYLEPLTEINSPEAVFLNLVRHNSSSCAGGRAGVARGRDFTSWA